MSPIDWLAEFLSSKVHQRSVQQARLSIACYLDPCLVMLDQHASKKCEPDWWHFVKNVRRDLFNLVAQVFERRTALLGRSAFGTKQVVHRGAADPTAHDLSIRPQHRKSECHEPGVVSDDAARVSGFRCTWFEPWRSSAKRPRRSAPRRPSRASSNRRWRPRSQKQRPANAGSMRSIPARA
jgi:hypothetical protein